ncbi:MAG: vWA domain-containing protein, partial [Acidimicrobiia bacterium]
MAVGFARLLRRAGLDVPVGSGIAFAQALAAVGMERRGGVYWAGRATLVRRPEDVGAYDRAFSAWWEGRVPIDLAMDVAAPSVTIALDSDDDTGGQGEEDSEPAGPTLLVRWSPTEVLRHKDFAAYTHAEFAEARRLMADLRLHGALRRSRRRRPSARDEGRPD